MKRLVALISCLTLMGCQKPLTTEQLESQCELDRDHLYANAKTPVEQDALYVSNCMTVHGYKRIFDPPMCSIGSSETNADCYKKAD